jgi:prophage regulatory protein
MQSIRLLRLSQVIDRTGLGKTKLYELQQHGLFPTRIKITAHAVGWIEEEVETWIAFRVFSTISACGSGSKRLTAPEAVPVSARNNRATFRLSLDAHGKNIDRSHSSRRLGWDSRRNRFCGGCRWPAAGRIFLQN